jgi:hypothetical protein
MFILEKAVYYVVCFEFPMPVYDPIPLGHILSGQQSCYTYKKVGRGNRVARFFRVTIYQNGENIPKCHKIHQMAG